MKLSLLYFHQTTPKVLLQFARTSRKRPVLSLFVLLGLLGGGYYAYSALFGAGTGTTYVMGEVTRGDVQYVITGSGQVSSSNQLALTPDVSGRVTSVAVKPGQRVKAGQLLLQIDATTALKAVRDAEANVQSARIALQKLQQPADTLSLLQAENAAAQADASLAKAYDDGYSTVSNAFLDMPSIMTGLNDLLNANESGGLNRDSISVTADTLVSYDSRAALFKADAEKKYVEARAAYDAVFTRYRLSSRSSSLNEIEGLIDDTYAAVKKIADAVKSVSELYNFVEDTLQKKGQPYSTTLATEEGEVAGYISDSNAHLLSLLGIRDTIASSKDAKEEKAESLRDLRLGTDTLDLASQQVVVTQRENALRDARETLAQYLIRAPFDGTVASVAVKRYDAVNTGSSMLVMVTDQQIAELTVSEVDVAQLAVGQKSTLTFDAIDGLQVDATVAEIESLGTVSQGVVSYAVKLSFVAKDTRVKGGMSTSAEIVTVEKKDTIRVPSGAVKQDGSGAYVLVFNPPVDVVNSRLVTTERVPVQVPVTPGIEGDTFTEIVDGVKEGDQVVIRESSSATSATSQQFRGPGGGIRP